MSSPSLQRVLPCLPVAEATREKIAKQLGLYALSFRSYETNGNLILRGVRIEKDATRPLLLPLSVEEISLAGITMEEPVVLHRHSGTSVTSLPSASAPSLWHEVLPYPFGLMTVPPFPSATLQYYPASWGADWQDLAAALCSLESALARTEVGCLWIRSKEAPPLLLLTHHVRRNRTKVGLAPSLHELGEAYDRGELTPEMLWQSFGTQAGFYHLEVPNITQGNPLITLTEAIGQTLRAPTHLIEFRLAKDPLPEFQL